MRACMHACVRVCVCACVRACVCVCVKCNTIDILKCQPNILFFINRINFIYERKSTFSAFL